MTRAVNANLGIGVHDATEVHGATEVFIVKFIVLRRKTNDWCVCRPFTPLKLRRNFFAVSSREKTTHSVLMGYDSTSWVAINCTQYDLFAMPHRFITEKFVKGWLTSPGPQTHRILRTINVYKCISFQIWWSTEDLRGFVSLWSIFWIHHVLAV